MAEGIEQIPVVRAVPGWGASIIAGAGAGVVAALASVGAEIVMHAQAPPRVATLWSAFVAGILGGILYGWLGRVVRRPAAALWVITLVVATIDSLLIATLPGASGPNPLRGIPIVGLLAPLRQLLALAGIGHLGTRHFPASSLLCGYDYTLRYCRSGVATRALVGETERSVTMLGWGETQSGAPKWEIPRWEEPPWNLGMFSVGAG